MKTKIYLSVLAGVLLLASCGEDTLDSRSIYGFETPEKTSFDAWLDDNFADPYNIHVQYRMDDMEVPFAYDMVPPSIETSKKMAYLIKHIFIDPYNEVAESRSAFMKQYAPRIITFVGDGDEARGTAEGGLKVVMYYLNDINYNKQTLATTYFKTLHHEFQHILNQKVRWPETYDLISDGKYVGAEGYKTVSLASALQAGFVSPYAQSMVGEDVAETYSWYVVLSPSEWDARMATAGSTGAGIITQKLNILKAYMITNFGVDMDLLRDATYRRIQEFDILGLDNLPF